MNNRHRMSCAHRARILSTLTVLAAMFATSTISAGELVQPKQVIVDSSLPTALADAQILAARRYGTFWNTGEAEFADFALGRDFTDRTLPAGRAQGVVGALAASRFIRAAVPDLSCDIEQMIVAGDRVVTHLHFRGHFTGRFKDTQGKGELVDFIATDIYRVSDGRIVENWHIEDNLTLLKQLKQIPE